MSNARSLLIIEDDQSFARALRRSFQRRGYEVTVCARFEDVVEALSALVPMYVVVDLKLPGASGLECIKLVRQSNVLAKIIVLTGFASIATAVEPIKLGACHYLAKPANSNDIEAAFDKSAGDSATPLTGRPTSLKTLEWERIHEVLVDVDFNVSEAARRLGMHRRTLARKLAKRRVT